MLWRDNVKRIKRIFRKNRSFNVNSREKHMKIECKKKNAQVIHAHLAQFTQRKKTVDSPLVFRKQNKKEAEKNEIFTTIILSIQTYFT